MHFNLVSPLNQHKFVRRESGTYHLVYMISVHMSIISSKLNHVPSPANISAKVVYLAFEVIMEMASRCDLMTLLDNGPIKMIVNMPHHVFIR